MFCLEPVGKRPKGAAPYTTLVPRGEDRPYYVGRVEETCAIFIDHHDVSRKHASLEITTFQTFLSQNPGARQYFTLWRESRADEQRREHRQRSMDDGEEEDPEESGSCPLDPLVEELLLTPLLRVRNLSRYGTKIQVIPDFHSESTLPKEAADENGGARSFILRDSEGDNLIDESGGGLEATGAEGVTARYVYIPSATHDQYIVSFGQSAHFKVTYRPVVTTISEAHYSPEYVFELTHMFRQLGCSVQDGGLPQPVIFKVNYAEVFLRVNEDEDLIVALHQVSAAVSDAAVRFSMAGNDVREDSETPDRDRRSGHKEGASPIVNGVSTAVGNAPSRHNYPEPSSSPIRHESRGRSAGAVEHDGLVDDVHGLVGGPSLRDLVADDSQNKLSDRDRERRRLEHALSRCEMQSRVTLQTKLVEFFAEQLQEVRLRPLTYLHVADEIDDSPSVLHALAIGYMVALPAYVFELFAMVAEHPTRPLHILPHPSVGSSGVSAEPLRKRSVYGATVYTHPVPTSCPISLHQIPDSGAVPRSRRDLFKERSFYLPTVPLQRKNGPVVALCGGRVVTYTEPPSAKAAQKAVEVEAELNENQRKFDAQHATRQHGGSDGTHSETSSAHSQPRTQQPPAPQPHSTQQALVLASNAVIDVEGDGTLPLGALFVGKYVVVSEALEAAVKDLYLYAQDAYAQYQRYPLATILNSNEALDQVIQEPAVVVELKDALLAVHRGWMPVSEKSLHVSLLSNSFVLHNNVVEELVIMAVEEQQQLGLHLKGLEASGADMVQNEIEAQRRRDILVRVFGAALAGDDDVVRENLLQQHNDALFSQLSEDKARKYSALAEAVMIAAPNKLGGGLMRSSGNRNSNLRVLDRRNNNVSAFDILKATSRHVDAVYNPEGRLVRRSMPVVDRLEGVVGNTNSLGTRNTPDVFPAEDVRKGIPLGLLKGRLNPFHRNKDYDPHLDATKTASSKRLGTDENNGNYDAYHNEGDEDAYDVDSDATPSSIDSREHNLNHKKIPEGRFTRELKIYDEAQEYKRLVLLAVKNSNDVLNREHSKLRALHATVLESVQQDAIRRQDDYITHRSNTPSKKRPPTLQSHSVTWLHALLGQHVTPQLELLERLALYRESRNPVVNDSIEGELLLGPAGGITSPQRRSLMKTSQLLSGSGGSRNRAVGDVELNSFIAGERRENGSVPLLERLWDEAEELRMLGEACLSQHAREVGHITTDGGYAPPIRYESEFSRRVEEILQGEAALGIKRLDVSKTSSSMRKAERTRANLKSPIRSGVVGFEGIAGISPASPQRQAKSPTVKRGGNSHRNGAAGNGVQRGDVSRWDESTVRTSRHPNVPSSSMSVEGNRKFALVSNHIAGMERDASGNPVFASPARAPSAATNSGSPAALSAMHKKHVARGTALARYPPLPLFVTQELHRNPRLAGAAQASPQRANQPAISRSSYGPTVQQYMGRDPISAHLSAAEALTAKLSEAVPPTDLKGVARRRGHFLKKYGSDEGEKRFTLWLGGQTPIWNREFYRSLDRNNLTLHGLFEDGW